MVKILMKYQALGQIRSSFTDFNSVWGFCFSPYKLSSISLYAQINHFSFCQRKTCNSWKQISQITPHYCCRKGVSSTYFVFSVSSADALDAIEVSEIALDGCLQATELYSGQSLPASWSSPSEASEKTILFSIYFSSSHHGPWRSYLYLLQSWG